MGEDRGAVAFAEKLLALLDLGSFSATYKYAVLLGLMDLCLEHTSQAGDAPTVVTTPQLARKVLALYWPHAAPFDPASGAVLRQNNTGQAEILSAIARHRSTTGAGGLATIAQCRAGAPDRFRKLERLVEWKLVEMPLPRVQAMGETAVPFIYKIGWTDRITKGAFESGDFDNRIHVLGQSGEYLVQLAGLLRPLIQREWLAMVARFNRELVGDARLAEFLFGVERSALSPVRNALRELQADRCFYCDDRLRRDAEVDHFVPWARYPDNGLENLVVADRGCNGNKRAFLADAEHVTRWKLRLDENVSEFDEIAKSARWERVPARTFSVARAIYLRLPAEAKLWRSGRSFVDVDRQMLRRALASG